MSFLSKLSRIFKEYPVAILCGLIILVCAGTMFFRSGRIVELSTAETDLNLRIRTIDQNTKNSKDLRADVEVMENYVQQLEQKLFNRDERAVNVNFFYGIESRLDIRILSISQVPAEYPLFAKKGLRELKLHSTITYNISLEGSFQSILEFLYELHRVDPLIRVVNINMAQGAERASGDGGLAASISLIVLAEK